MGNYIMLSLPEFCLNLLTSKDESIFYNKIEVMFY